MRCMIRSMGHLFPDSDEFPDHEPLRSALPEFFGDVTLKTGITAFAFGAGMAIHEGHGDPPAELHESPYAAGRAAIAYQTSAASSVSFQTLLYSSSTNVFPLK